MPASRADGRAVGRAIALPAAAVCAGLLHAALMALAFPPFNVWWLVFAAPVPLTFVALADARADQTSRVRSWGPMLGVLVGVLPLWLYEMQWVIGVSAFGYVPMCVVLAGFSASFPWLAARLRRRHPTLPMAAVVPLAWVAVEFFRGEIACTGFAWLLLGHPLIRVEWLAAPAAVGGTYLISALAAAMTGAVADMATGRPCMGLVGIAVATATWAGAGLAASTARSVGGRTVRVAVVQTNVPQSNKTYWTIPERLGAMTRFEAMTRRAAAEPRPDVIAWPETMFPGLFLDPASVEAERRFGLTLEVRNGERIESTVFVDRLLVLQREVGVPMLIGGVAADNLRFEGGADGVGFKYEARFNSVFLVSSGAVDSRRYDKLELTPFGEMLPYVTSWPTLRAWVKRNFGAIGMFFDLSAGQNPVAFGVAGVRVVTPICFEATRARLCRRLVQSAGDGAVVMVNLTNDGWFGAFDPAREQHAQIARWRCVELGVPMVRAANTGVSTAIDGRGRVTARVDEESGARVEGVMLAEVMAGSGRTIYARVGDVVGWLIMVGAALLAWWPRGLRFSGARRKS
jgi:apolipoprotein N-acyltransferase